MRARESGGIERREKRNGEGMHSNTYEARAGRRGENGKGEEKLGNEACTANGEKRAYKAPA